MAFPILPLIAVGAFLLSSRAKAATSRPVEKKPKAKKVEVKQPDKPAAKPKPKNDGSAISAAAAYAATQERARRLAEAQKRANKAAAAGLAAWMLKTSKREGPEVKRFQAAMGKIAADGKVGPKTEARARELGHPLPSVKIGRAVVRPQPAPAKPKPKPTTPQDRITVTETSSKPMVLQREAPAKKETRYVPITTMPSALTPEAAAAAYRDYLRNGGNPGSKKAPSAEIYKFQRAMGGLTLDGINGPKTAARAAALLTPSVAAKTPKQHAQDLRAHLARGGSPGRRGAPSSEVRAAQAGMGDLVADGIFGPKTRARAKALGVEIEAAA